MDSGLYSKVFSSPEVIAASLFLILLLPLVFFIASTKSRRKLVRTTRFTRPPRSRTRPAPAARESEEDSEEPAGPRRPGAEEDDRPDPDAEDRR